MTECQETCLPFLPTRCGDCPLTLGVASMNTLSGERLQTGSPIGSSVQAIPYLRPLSSEHVRALSLLNEVWVAVDEMAPSREASMVKTKIEEAEMWLRKVRP